VKGNSALRALMHNRTMTAEQLIGAALSDLEPDATDRKVLSAVFEAWCAVRNAYLEALTAFTWEHYADKDRLARHAERILVAAARRYGDPFDRWEVVPYCSYDCENCSEADCDREAIRDELSWTAASTIATVVYLWQELQGTLPFPAEPDEAAVLAYHRAHPRPKYVGALDAVVEQRGFWD
jgi:hypothetical protein